MKEAKFLSVVIPAYKAEDLIQKSLLRVKQVLDGFRYPYEVICVVDGKVDKTFQKASVISSKFPQKIKVLGYEKNMGKGHAVRFGMSKAKGDIVGFIDAGDINPTAISMLLDHFEWYDADIIVGSKRHPVSRVIYPIRRKFFSICYQVLVRLLFGLNIKDTQAGVKFFRREVLQKILPRLLVKRWAFDVEMLAVANYLGYGRIYEAPIKAKIDFGGVSVLTSKSFISTVWGMFVDTLAVFYRLHILHYYDSDNRKNWVSPKYLSFNK